MTADVFDAPAEAVRRFQQDGAICLRQCFAQRWIDVLAAGFERNLADPGPNASCFTPSGNPGGYFDDFLNWQRIAEYRQFIFDSPAAAIAATAMSSTSVRILLENMLVKEPGTLEASPWHQDQPYYCVDGRQLCSVWFPLDPIPRAVCVEFVAGSHRWDKLFTPRRFGDHSEYQYPAGTFDDAPDPDGAGHRILAWDLEPGDCVVFHMRSLHRAPGTPGLATRRRAFSTRWLGDDAVYAVRPGEMFPKVPPPYPEPGAPMEHPAFPIVWPRGGGAPDHDSQLSART